MEITLHNYQKAINALRRCAEENKHRNTDTGNIVISDLCDDVANFLQNLNNGEYVVITAARYNELQSHEREHIHRSSFNNETGTGGWGYLSKISS